MGLLYLSGKTQVWKHYANNFSDETLGKRRVYRKLLPHPALLRPQELGIYRTVKKRLSKTRYLEIPTTPRMKGEEQCLPQNVPSSQKRRRRMMTKVR